MARSGIAVDETIECPWIASGVASERLLGLASTEYRAVNVGANQFQFARTFRPTWAIVLGIILLPVIIGIFFFLIRSTETWTATVDEDHRRVRVRVSGKVLPAMLITLREAMEARPDAAPLMATGVVATLPVQTPQGLVTSVPQAMAAPVQAAAPHPPPPPPPPPAPPVGAPVAVGPPPGAPPAPLGGPPLTGPPPPAPPANLAPTSWAPPSPTSWAPPAESAQPTPGWVPPAVGLPPEGPAIPSSARPETAPTPGPVHEPPSETTNLSAAVRAAAAAAPFTLVFDTGQRHPVQGLVLVGRDPVGADDERDADLVAIDDVDRSVSKTHLSVRSGSDGVLVTDRASTNGSATESATGERVALAPQEPVLVAAGSIVHFGKRTFRVEAAE